MSSITVNNLTGGYEDKPLFSNLSLQIEKANFTAIAGPNGSGKSTLLKYLIKELKSSEKTVFVLDKDIATLKQEELAKLIGLVAQNSSRDYEFTVAEYISMGRYCHKDEATNTEALSDALRITGIGYLRDKLITRISGGEFQMVVLARAICQNPDVILLDEPINNLDPFHQLKMLELLKKLSETGKSVICVLHDLNSILRFSDNCVLMKDGKVFCSGATADVLTRENIKDVYNVDCQIITPECDRFGLITYYTR